ncbi:hypothetical protein [Meiothermus ruber]|jgi:hypothetical protein|uniref:hypothetical protein n=1 Tax=Meiothermus ruber TaxID=277 RepID=UPI000ACBDD53|nr:hypothetical protein [Meiothermus ruber]MCL6530971.1 hypothetical protein [Meiothermus ruber]
MNKFQLYSLRKAKMRPRHLSRKTPKECDIPLGWVWSEVQILSPRPSKKPFGQSLSGFFARDMSLRLEQVVRSPSQTSQPGQKSPG